TSLRLAGSSIRALAFALNRESSQKNQSIVWVSSSRFIPCTRGTPPAARQSPAPSSAACSSRFPLDTASSFAARESALPAAAPAGRLPTPPPGSTRQSAVADGPGRLQE